MGAITASRVGCFIEGGAAGPKESARMVLEPDGDYLGLCRLVRHRPGTRNGVRADRRRCARGADRTGIRGVFHGTTSYVSDGYGAYHSRSVVMGGSAMLDAANNLHDAIRAARGRAARLRRPREVEIVEGIKAVGPGGKSIAARGAHERRHLGRGRLSQQEAHLHLRRSRRACGGRSQARPCRVHRLRDRRGLRARRSIR